MTNTSAKSKEFLNLLLLGASIPFHMLYVGDTVRNEPVNSLSSITRFSSAENTFVKNKRTFIGITLAFIVLSVASLYWDASQWILLAYGSVMFYHMNLAYRLQNFERGNRLVYDHEFQVYEYRSKNGTVVFKNEDIRQIVLHESGFNTRIADIHLNDKVVRITNKLVNFDMIPLLDENGLDSKYHPFLFKLP
jgi:hypothetical protein